ncbi:hypothetical protein BJ508DRAFT_322116 [Ascobolus immersus RN42]|uniref:Uncharacterized protein n=1 Tax=Ascobolus immersus RN42 TaxID=1160509 RepID=A0A3N4IIK5_ASCIM|nr:hypothetical protein BJ508DRAFT_322116 [Ascobolus immersus RN42]
MGIILSIFRRVPRWISSFLATATRYDPAEDSDLERAESYNGSTEYGTISVGNSVSNPSTASSIQDFSRGQHFSEDEATNDESLENSEILPVEHSANDTPASCQPKFLQVLSISTVGAESFAPVLDALTALGNTYGSLDSNVTESVFQPSMYFQVFAGSGWCGRILAYLLGTLCFSLEEVKQAARLIDIIESERGRMPGQNELKEVVRVILDLPETVDRTGPKPTFGYWDGESLDSPVYDKLDASVGADSQETCLKILLAAQDERSDQVVSHTRVLLDTRERFRPYGHNVVSLLIGFGGEMSTGKGVMPEDSDIIVHFPLDKGSISARLLEHVVERSFDIEEMNHDAEDE